MANQPKKYKKFVVTAATATLVAAAIAPVASAAEFKDVAGNDHEVAINALADAGIIKGYADGTFKPNQTVTRGQVVKLLGRWLETLDQEIPEDWKTEQRFDDVLTSNKDEELVKYAALTKDAGVFNGSEGKLNATQTMTRQQMALVLVRAIKEVSGVDLVAEYKEEGHVTEISDLDKAHGAEQRNAIVALEYAGITKVSTFNPNNSITRGQFASFLYRTIENVLEAPKAGVKSIKAINNTTVEVTFEDEVEDVKALDFTIADLEVKNAAVKQTNSKVVVLTTAAQTADKEYTVSLDEEKVGSFKGVEAVIPTAVDITEKSLQAPVGTQVTLKAQVTVKEGQSKEGIPVTFNIVNSYGDNNTGTLNKPIVVEATTNADGVATYSYTRYAQTSYQIASHDEVQAYATGNATARSFSKVYWANLQPLAITEVTEGNTVQNGGKKVYKLKVALEHAENVTAAEYAANTSYYNAKGIYSAGKYVNVGYQENTNVTPDKAVKTVDVIDASGKNLGYPGQYTTSTSGGNSLNGWVKEVKIQLDNNGEAVFTLSDLDGVVTPYLFVDQKVNPSNDNGTTGRFEATELFVKAPTVTFGKQHTLVTKIESVGTQFAAAFYNDKVDLAGKKLVHDGDYIENKLSNQLPTATSVTSLANYTKAQLAELLADTGGRDYKITVTDKNGKLAPKGTKVGVDLAYGTSQRVNGGAIYFVDNTNKSLQYVTTEAADGKKDRVIWTEVDANGQVSFTLIGYKDAYVTPTAVIDSGDKKNEVDKNDQKIPGEIVYFADAKVSNAVLNTSKTTAKADGTEEIEFTYQTVDQNGKAYRPALNNLSSNNPELNNVPVTFELTTTFNPIEVKVGTAEFPNFVNLNTNVVEVGPDSNGNYLNNPNNYRSLTVVANEKGIASVKVTAKNGTDLNVVASTSLASLPQLLRASVSFVNTTTVPSNYSGIVNSYHSVDKTLTFGGKTPVSYANATYFHGSTQLDETGFISALKNAQGSVLVNRTVTSDGTKFTILNINNTGNAPTDSAEVIAPPAPTVSASLTDTDGDKDQIGGDLVITATNANTTEVTVNGVALQPVQGKYTVAQDTPANAVIIVKVTNTAGVSAQHTVTVTDYVKDEGTDPKITVGEFTKQLALGMTRIIGSGSLPEGVAFDKVIVTANGKDQEATITGQSFSISKVFAVADTTSVVITVKNGETVVATETVTAFK